jgi:UDP-arabinose 4-epimerase
MKRILITGGVGYIGSHMAKAVARWGWEPVIFDNFSAGHEWAIQWGPSVRADLADSEAIRSAIRQYRPDAVVHFAASAYVGESMVNPRKDFRNNVVNSLNLLDVMLEEGVDTIVFSSSCATYGIPAVVPISEDSPQQPSSPYGESKLFVEKALRAFGGTACTGPRCATSTPRARIRTAIWARITTPNRTSSLGSSPPHSIQG